MVTDAVSAVTGTERWSYRRTSSSTSRQDTAPCRSYATMGRLPRSRSRSSSASRVTWRNCAHRHHGACERFGKTDRESADGRSAEPLEEPDQTITPSSAQRLQPPSHPPPIDGRRSGGRGRALIAFPVRGGLRRVGRRRDSGLPTGGCIAARRGTPELGLLGLRPRKAVFRGSKTQYRASPQVRPRNADDIPR